ncbi:MAG: glycosyltransferase involved in cell wall biosynthesis [Parvicellaceae bacterium]|jgi:glycosyltransferase involved in cell wall biosynthesis
MKRLAIIGTVGVPGRYGGFETMVDNILPYLTNNYNVTVFCSRKFYSKEERLENYKGAKLIYLPFNANGPQSIVYDVLSLFLAVFNHQHILSLGVSGGIAFPFVRRLTNRKLIVNIDGLEWRRAKWGRTAKSFLKYSERLAVKYSHADITDNMGIKRYTSIKYKTLSHLIPYGADHAKPIAIRPIDRLKYPFINGLYAFKVARIEPENNLDMILEAFTDNGKRNLVVVGNWENSKYGIYLKKNYSSYPNIHLLDPIYDPVLLNVIRSNAHLYIHGHSAGGTNPSLIEAMYLGLPVLAFDVSFNRYTTHDKALYFKGREDLELQLESFTYSDLVRVRTNLKEVANQHYTWKLVGRQYVMLLRSFEYNYKKSQVALDLSRVSNKILLDQGIMHLSRTKHYYQK